MSKSAAPSDTMAERSAGSTWKQRVLLEADRRAVAAGLMAAVFLGVVAASAATPTPFRSVMRSTDVIHTLFQGLTTALITGVTLVVSINSLVLSQELGAVDDQRERLDGALEFRESVADTIDEPVSPADPGSFIAALVGACADRATAFRDALDQSTTDVDDADDADESDAGDADGSDAGDESDAGDADADDLFEDVDDFVTELTTHADRVRADLTDAQFGTYAVIGAALNFNYSWKVFQARRIGTVHADAIPDAARDAHADLLDALEQFGLAREHFKTLYFQWELIALSRAMLYAAVPALIVTISMLLFFNTAVVEGSILGVDVLVLAVAAATTVAVTPFLLLVSFLLRIATMARRTLAIGPFVLRRANRTTVPDGDE
ncbi:hypothetical protein GWK26_05070 [haloarchaeon 3A1-DGR]|nr:hypothetical protein GWK26_05070 [haloarchaeon 3A1-DGR]